MTCARRAVDTSRACTKGVGNNTYVDCPIDENVQPIVDWLNDRHKGVQTYQSCGGHAIPSGNGQLPEGRFYVRFYATPTALKHLVEWGDVYISGIGTGTDLKDMIDVSDETRVLIIEGGGLTRRMSLLYEMRLEGELKQMMKLINCRG